MIRRNSFNAFQLSCINIYMTAALGIFYVRFQMFWGAAGCQHPLTQARLGAENGLLSRSQGVRAVSGSPLYLSRQRGRAGHGCAGCRCLAAPGKGRRMRSGAAGSGQRWQGHVLVHGPAGDAAGGQLSLGSVCTSAAGRAGGQGLISVRLRRCKNNRL